MIEKIRANKDPNYGFNAATGEYEDLVKAGVIDPTKVTRSALQNAASISALMLTTEAMICEIPEKKSAPMPGGHEARRRRNGLLVHTPKSIVKEAAPQGAAFLLCASRTTHLTHRLFFHREPATSAESECQNGNRRAYFDFGKPKLGKGNSVIPSYHTDRAQKLANFQI